MKKLISLLLAALLLASMGAFALAETLGDGSASTEEATMSVTTIDDMVSVEVNWGALEFAYTEEGWNPATRIYTEKTGITPVNGSNYVTVVNYSNVDVTVTCELSDVASGITGSVDGSGSISAHFLSACTGSDSAPAHSFTIDFTAGESFNPEGSSGRLKLANVTVSVKRVS